MAAFSFRLLGMVGLGLAGLGIALERGAQDWRWMLVPALGAGAAGFIVTPHLTIYPFRWVISRMKSLPSHVLVGGTVGLVIGLVVAALLALPISFLPDLASTILPLTVAVILAYLGAVVMASRGREVWYSLTSYFRPPVEAMRTAPNGKVLLDTSAIIDGRIADVSQTGFIPGVLLVPRFVLDELRHIADSPDASRRNRGRRGLDMLARLQKDPQVPIQVTEVEVGDGQDTDAKLVKLARTLGCPIITNDFNLNRVAGLQGVRVLNVNELANAVKSVALPGEELSLRIIQEGKEAGRGVGFLDDGTMVVVGGGRRYLNAQIDVQVTRSLQTAAGRLLFATPKVGGA